MQQNYLNRSGFIIFAIHPHQRTVVKSQIRVDIFKCQDKYDKEFVVWSFKINTHRVVLSLLEHLPAFLTSLVLFPAHSYQHLNFWNLSFET